MPEPIEARLVRIETKLDGFLAGQRDQDTTSHDHESRIRKLERWQYVATGIAAAAGSGVGALFSSLLNGGN